MAFAFAEFIQGIIRMLPLFRQRIPAKLNRVESLDLFSRQSIPVVALGNHPRTQFYTVFHLVIGHPAVAIVLPEFL